MMWCMNSPGNQVGIKEAGGRVYCPVGDEEITNDEDD